MSSEMVLCAFFSFMWGWGITKISIPLSFRYRILDMPESRKLHNEVTPRGGGIVLWSGLLLFLLLARDHFEFDPSFFAWCASATFLVGYLDDMRSLSPKVRLLVHIAASIVALIPLYKSGNFPLWGWLTASLWIAAMISAYNMIDGMNGLVLGIFAASSCMFMVVFHNIFWAFGFGIAIGILPWNFPEARTFLGDGGSTLLGFFHASILLYSIFSYTPLTQSLIPLCLFLAFAGGIPFIDMCFAILRRTVKGVSPFYPDKGHIHHRLLRRGFTPPFVLVLMVSFHLAMLFISIRFF
jgi:UDP-GlcNAc:undecaprenyl-phosphate GlcNAc-1-phosphate transferase